MTDSTVGLFIPALPQTQAKCCSWCKNIDAVTRYYGLDRKCSQQVHMLHVWSPAGGAIWGAVGNFGRGGPSLRVGHWGDCISNLFPFLCFLSVTRWEPPLPHTWAAVTSGLDSCSRTSRVWSESKHVFPWARLLMLSILSLQCNRNGYMSHGVF